MKVDLEMGCKKDERLEFVKEQTAKAITIFTEAIKASSEEQEQISFKAFTLNTSKEEAEKVFNTIMTMVAIELFQQVPELVKTITFFHSIESQSESEHCLLLHCDKTKTPPSKDEIDACLQKEKEDFAVSVSVPLGVKEADEVILPHPSIMSAYKRSGSE